MTFWQENYAFIKDVYDTRAAKMTEIMDKTEKAIADVVADKIYTSAEFKKVKEVFTVGSYAICQYCSAQNAPTIKKVQ